MNLLVAAADGVVREYDLATGAGEGNYTSGLGNAIGIATLGGDVYVGSFTNSNVQRFAYPIAGTGAIVVNTTSGMGQPAGIAAGPDGKLYIASFSNNRIMSYDPVTDATATFVTAGLGGLDRPHGVAFGPDGGLYVGSFDGNVYRYTSSGASDPSPLYSAAVYAQVNNGSGDAGPRGLTFGPDRSGDGTPDLYVTDQLNREIRVYAGPNETGGAQPGAFLETYIGYSPTDPGSLTDPVGVAFIDTKFYVSDFVQRKIKVYDAATGAFESDLVADVGANPTYFIAIVPEPNMLSLAGLAVAALTGYRMRRQSWR